MTLTTGDLIVIPAGQYTAQDFIGAGGTIPDLIPTGAHLWTGVTQASAITPIPEPTLVSLVGIAFVALTLRRTRKGFR